MSFPQVPIDGQSYSNALGTEYRFDSTRSIWVINSQEITGNTGIQGVTGISGSSGSNGVTGVQGVTGIQGTASIFRYFWV